MNDDAKLQQRGSRHGVVVTDKSTGDETVNITRMSMLTFVKQRCKETKVTVNP